MTATVDGRVLLARPEQDEGLCFKEQCGARVFEEREQMARAASGELDYYKILGVEPDVEARRDQEGVEAVADGVAS